MSMFQEDPYSALMGGGQPDPQMMGDPGGMDAMQGPPMMPPEDAAPQELSAVDHLRTAIEHAQAALVSEPDDGDSQALAKVVQGLYAILATRQKESDQTMGNPTLLRTLRRSGS